MDTDALRRLRAQFQIQNNGMSDFPPCHTLRARKDKIGLTLSQITGLMFALQFLEGLGEIDYSSSPPVLKIEGLQIELDFLIAENIQEWLETHIATQVDITHISKFMRGSQFPWDSARQRMALLFSVLEGRPITVFELFPEIKESLQLIQQSRNRLADSNFEPKIPGGSLAGDADLAS